MKTFKEFVRWREGSTDRLGWEDNQENRKLMSLVKIAVEKYPKRVTAMLEELRDHDHKIRAGLEELRAMPQRKMLPHSPSPDQGDDGRDVIVPASADAQSGDYQ